MMRFYSLWICLACLIYTEQFDFDTCRQALGIESRRISDAAFSSSSHAGPNSSPFKARIRSETDGWCPLNKISSTSYEYLQIDLNNLTVITMIELQGKFSSMPTDRFAEAFRLEYRRDFQQPWIHYNDFSGQSVLHGNTNNYIPSMRDLVPSIVARQIRFVPVTEALKEKYVCVRLELYGCSYQGGPMSYTIAQGDQRGYEAEFADETYDGQNERGVLKGGLGQLTDGIIGHDDYEAMDNVQGIGPVGYDWVGWKRRTSTVNLTFYFSSVRNWTSIRLHTSNLFIRRIYLFYSISISACHQTNRQQWHWIIPRDANHLGARWIQISFGGELKLISDCLHLVLTHDNRSDWILLSEVQFDSRSVSIDTNTHLPMFLNSPIPLAHYAYWMFFAASLITISVVTFIFIYLRYIQPYQQRPKQFQKIHNDLQSDSRYHPISTESPMSSSIDDSHTSYGISTCFTSNQDLNPPVLISTSKSSKYTPSTTHISTLDRIDDDTLDMTINPYASIDMYISPLSHSSLSTEHSSKGIQGPCGNSTYMKLSSDNQIAEVSLPMINNTQLIFGNRYSLSKGTFGMIYHGSIQFDPSCETVIHVLIKILHTADDKEKEKFHQEHEQMHYLHHANLAQFFGYTVHHHHALIEHSPLGDAHTHLSMSNCLSMNIRLYLITQLSSALAYLESEQILHRDIAARNCLLFANYELKLSNVAMATEQFQHHYYSIDHGRLPIRWMSPECVRDGQFTLQSEVWAFGITLWEMLSHCRTLPYASLHNEEIYHRLKSTNNLHLPKPDDVNKELIDLMLECWRPSNERPSFYEINTFFHRRLQGLNIQ